MDKVIQGNTSNIIFLKSTDDSMLDTLQKMSGTTHRSYVESKTITRDTGAIIKNFNANESKVSYTMSTKEVPVISYNDMAFIGERNSIVFRAGDAPVWNRNETILPMSYKLFDDTIVNPGQSYSLQTVPTLSSALEFDVKQNQPDFGKMLDKRMRQAWASSACQDMYKMVYDYTDFDIAKLDRDIYSDEIMDMINREINHMDISDYDEMAMSEEEMAFNEGLMKEESIWAQGEVNKEQFAATAEWAEKQNARQEKRFAEGLLSPDDIIDMNGTVKGKEYQFDIINTYLEIKGYMWQDKDHFLPGENGGLLGADGTPYIVRVKVSDDLKAINEAITDPGSYTYGEERFTDKDVSEMGTYQVTNEFYSFLASQRRWTFADGKFDREFARRLRAANGPNM